MEQMENQVENCSTWNILCKKMLSGRKYLGKMMLSGRKHVENLETLGITVDNAKDNCINLGCRDVQNDYN